MANLLLARLIITTMNIKVVRDRFQKPPKFSFDPMINQRDELAHRVI